MKYILTRYYNNGESWEDEFHREEPIAVFDSLSDFKEKTKNILELKYSFSQAMETYKKIEEDKDEFLCPYKHEAIGEYCPHKDCWIDEDALEKYESEDYEDIDIELDILIPKIYQDCEYEYYRSYDNSYYEYRLYQIEEFDSKML